MPNYDFKCEECGHKFTRLVPIAEKDQVKCPLCNSKTKQLFTGFSVGGNSSKISGNTCSSGG